MLAGGLRAALCCVDTQQLDASFAGRDFDAALLDALPAGVDPCGENGEFPTCVSDGPMFTAALALECGHTVLRDNRFAYTDYAQQPMSHWLPPLRRQGRVGEGCLPSSERTVSTAPQHTPPFAENGRASRGERGGQDGKI